MERVEGTYSRDNQTSVQYPLERIAYRLQLTALLQLRGTLERIAEFGGLVLGLHFTVQLGHRGGPGLRALRQLTRLATATLLGGATRTTRGGLGRLGRRGRLSSSTRSTR